MGEELQFEGDLLFTGWGALSVKLFFFFFLFQFEGGINGCCQMCTKVACSH